MTTFPLLFALLACGPHRDAAATASTHDTVDLTVTLDPPASGVQLVTEPFVIEAATEREVCSVVRLEAGETLLWTDRMETLVSAGSHHMNVFIGQFSFLDPFMGDGAAEAALGVPVGQYDCGELSVMESAFPVFPSQRENQEITFPTGVAAPLMSPALLILSHHYVNVTDTPVLINAALNVETVPAASVEHVASLVFDSIDDLEIPPGESVVRHRTCVVDRDVSVALVSTHNHQQTQCATLNDFDGETVAPDPFFVNKEWDTPPILHFDPGGFDLTPGEGVHYACHYDNTTDSTLVNDGTAEGEMCVFAAVVYPATWSVAQVEDTVAAGDVGGLLALLDETLGPCPASVDAPSPWDDGGDCATYDQTESNVLE